MIQKGPFLNGFFIIFFLSSIMSGCEDESQSEHQDGKIVKDYIRKIEGKSEPIPQEIASRGEVLVAYSGCYDCHKLDKRAKGPAFKDIAKRYPANPIYRDMLARKVISGGFGSWGNPVMSPHPNITIEDAQNMVYFILSLEEKR
ncbi:MAG: c-type cytochrome [Cyclobacteriaceae bacterium]